MAALAAAFGVSTTAGATPPGGVVEYPSVSYIQSQTGMISAPFILVDDYTNIGDGGGGYFTLVDTASYCKSGATHNLQDGGVTIGDSALNTQPTHCYLRRFTGPVHLKWYGIASQTDGTSASSTVTALNNAFAVAAAANPGVTAAANRTVDTDGMRIYVNQSIEIPADVRLTCDATPGGQRQSSGHPDYSATPASIVFTNPASPTTLAGPLITMTGGPPLRHDNSELDHCILLTTGQTDNADSKIILNPGGNPPAPAIQDAMQDVRNMVNNGSTGVECTAGGCSIRDNLIIGFDTAIEGSDAAHLKLRSNAMDADVGVFLTDIGSPVDITGFEMDSFLTHGINNKYDQGISTDRGADGHSCRITATTTGYFADFKAHDPVDVTGVTPLNCRGLAFVDGVDINGRWIDLANTTVDSPTVTSSWAAGTPVISVSATAGVWQGMSVTCSGSCSGFPSSATIVNVSPYVPLNGGTAKIAISASTTAAGGGTLTVSTLGSPVSPTVYLYAALRPRAGASEGGAGTCDKPPEEGCAYGRGTCIQAGKNNDTEDSGLGVKVVNAQCYGHEVAYAFSASGPGGCVNCSGNSPPEIQDLGQIALLARGSQTGYLGFSNIAIAGVGGAIVDLTSDHCVGFNDAQIDPGTPGGIGFRATNGCFTATGVRSGIGGPPNWLLEKGASGSPVSGTITASNSPNTTVYEEDSSVVAQVSCASNTFATSTCGNSLFSVASAGSTPGCVVLGGSCTVAGTNNAMAVTTPSTVATTTASITFVPAFSSAPTCVANNKDTATTARVTVSNSLPGSITLKFSASVTNVTVNVLCIGH